MKAQLMSLTMLLLFVLMLSILYFFITINLNSDMLAQTSALASGSANMESNLASSASQFGNSSASAALYSLAYYEYNASLRKSNFITNLSESFDDLMANATLPGEPLGSHVANIMKARMGSLTFNAYNSSILYSYNNTAQVLYINETKPILDQYNPYTLSIKYIENIKIIQSGSVYRYSIPVNASINLNGTPDLWYAEHGILRDIKFGNINNLTHVVGNTYAVYGSLNNFAYAPVWQLPAGTSSCSGVPSNFIIAISNSMTLSNECYNDYAGLITQQVSGTPTVPYLVYSSNSNIINHMQSGNPVLLYGPGLDTLNIENMRAEISNNYFFASPYSPSYVNRSENNMRTSSPEGLFTFSGYSRTTPYFNGKSSYIALNSNSFPFGNSARTLAGWVNLNTPPAGNGWEWIASYGTPTVGNSFFIGFNYDNNQVDCGGYGNDILYPVTLSNYIRKWDYIACTYDGTTAKLYVNGLPVDSGAFTWNTIKDLASIGRQTNGGEFLNGSIANVQLYNISLSGSQIDTLFTEGISGLPISNSGLVGWWPLDGNANDYSGNGQNGIPTNVIYTTPSQGIASTQVGNFNGYNSNVTISLSESSLTGFTACEWIYNYNNPSGKLSGNTISSTEPLSINSGNGVFELYSNTIDLWLGSPASSTNYNLPLPDTWYYICGTYTPSATTLYVNGNFASTVVPTQSSISFTQVKIGDGQNSVSGSNIYQTYFPGMISNVQLYSSALSGPQIASLYLEGIDGAPPQNSPLIGWWPLDGNTNDYSNNGNAGSPNYLSFSAYNGSAEDSAFPSGVPNLVYPIPGILSCTVPSNCFNQTSPSLYLGTQPLLIGNKYLESAYPNGGYSNQFLGVSPNSRLEPNALTIGLWFYEPSYPPCYPAIGINNHNFNQGYNLLLPCQTDSNGGITIGNGAEVYDTFKASADAPGRWHYAAATFDGSTITTYINGVEQNTNTQSGITYSGITWDLLATTGTYLNNVSIANIQIYNASFSQPQITQMYAEGISGAPIDMQHLIGWWPLNGNCYDYSNNGNNCITSQNLGYIPLYGSNALAPTLSGAENEWQAIGFAVPPSQ